VAAMSLRSDHSGNLSLTPVPGSNGTPFGSSDGGGSQMSELVTYRYNLAVMGHSCVGKTALTTRFTRNNFIEAYYPTIEDLHLKVMVLNGMSCEFKIFDTAGDEGYMMQLRRNWMEQRNGLVFVFSLTDRRTFDDLPSFREELLDVYHGDPPPCVLIANKADVDADQWAVTAEEAKSLEEQWRNCRGVFFTSAKTNQNVDQAFSFLMQVVHSQAASDRIRRSSVDRHAFTHVDYGCHSRSTCERCADRCAVL